MVFLLPETAEADLPDTIGDAEDLGTNNERRRKTQSGDSNTELSNYQSMQAGESNEAFQVDVSEDVGLQ